MKADLPRLNNQSYTATLCYACHFSFASVTMQYWYNRLACLHALVLVRCGQIPHFPDLVCRVDFGSGFGAAFG